MIHRFFFKQSEAIHQVLKTAPMAILETSGPPTEGWWYRKGVYVLLRWYGRFFAPRNWRVSTLGSSELGVVQLFAPLLWAPIGHQAAMLQQGGGLKTSTKLSCGSSQPLQTTGFFKLHEPGWFPDWAGAPGLEDPGYWKRMFAKELIGGSVNGPEWVCFKAALVEYVIS
jgi:hypothetical protein